MVTDLQQSKVVGKVAFAPAPVAVTRRGANWLWALAVPDGTKQKAEAMEFIEWYTSKDCSELVAENNGWSSVSTGTCKSTCANQDRMQAASFADAELKAILSADPDNSTLEKNPCTSVQLASIPEFHAIGVDVGKQFNAALVGNISVAEAVEQSPKAADRELRKAGYY